MKYRIIAITVLFFVSALLTAGGPPPSENKYVKFSASLKQDKLKAGSKGLLLIKLEPQSGIHINLQPPMSLKLEDTSAVRLGSKLEFSKIKKDTSEFLDASKPITQPFMIVKDAKPGVATLTATLTYFYCSDADGWCSRFRQPVDMKINVVH